MKAVNVFTHPLCPDCFAIVVVSSDNRLWIKYYTVTEDGITETDNKRARRLLNRQINDWRLKTRMFMRGNISQKQ